MAMTVGNEKTFEYFSDFFPELRQCVVDEMDPTDRCRFTRCSKRSSREAKRSKNYIYGLKIIGHSEENVIIYIGYDKSDLAGCIIQFLIMNGKKIKKCENSTFRALWIEELDDSANLVQLAGEYFKSLLKPYQKRIKHVSIGGILFKDYDFEIDSLDSLERLGMVGIKNFDQYFSKLRKPLKRLSIRNGGNSEKLSSYEQVYQVEGTICSADQTFSYEQILRFSAPRFYIDIGSLTERNIASLIQSWKNGTIKEVLYCWYLHDSSFDAFELLRLLGVPHDDLSRTCFEIQIKHNKEAGKIAKLKYINELYQNQIFFLCKDQASSSSEFFLFPI